MDVYKLKKAIKVMKRDHKEEYLILCSIFTNILKFPNQPKFRRIKLNNKLLTKLKSVSNGVEILVWGGFTQNNEDEYIFLKKDFDLEVFKARFDFILFINGKSLQKKNSIIKWKEVVNASKKFRKDPQIEKYLLSKSTQLVGKIQDFPESSQAVLLCHSYDLLGRFYRWKQEGSKSIINFREATKYARKIDTENSNSTQRTFMLSAMTNLAESLIVSNSKVDAEEAFALLYDAWKVCNGYKGETKVFRCRIAILLSIVYYRCQYVKEARDWVKIARQLSKKINPLGIVLDIICRIESSNADELGRQIGNVIKVVEQKNEEFAGTLFSLLLFFCLKFDDSDVHSIEEGIENGKKALKILSQDKAFGDKHWCVLKTYSMLSKCYEKLDDEENKKKYEDFQLKSRSELMAV